MIPAEGRPEPAGMVGEPNVGDLPAGYRYGVTRYADLILRLLVQYLAMLTIAAILLRL